MSSIFQKRPLKDSLPLSQNPTLPDQTLRRRLSALSFKIQPTIPPTSWFYHKSKSMSSMGQYAGSSITKWWDSAWAWLLTKKPTFAQDLEMNEEESNLLGFHNKGSWKHVFYKVKAELRRVVGSSSGASKGFTYDSYSYQKNFDDGMKIKKSED